MFPIQAYLAASHIDDLRREAAAARLAREVALGQGDTFGGSSRPPLRPDVRRVLALAAARLSLLADGAARRLDPCLEEGFGLRHTAGVTGR
jgi:hypothetical protein